MYTNMEHSSHAHPLSDAPNTSMSSTTSPLCTLALSTTPNFTAQQQIEGPSPNTRRLHLRNAGFRAPVLPSRRITPLFTSVPTSVEPYHRAVFQENTPMSAEKRSVYGEHLPPSPVNILQEIHNSQRRKRISPRPAFGMIFQDHTMTEDASGSSWFNEGSSNGSPSVLGTSPLVMGLREGSLNQKTPPPLNSPLAKHAKQRKSNRCSSRGLTSEPAEQVEIIQSRLAAANLSNESHIKYIEHLESQLIAANAKMEALTSPKTNKLRASKIRRLTVENRNLQAERAEWEKELDARVREEREQHLDIEAALKEQVHTLTDELETEKGRVAELEWELESMRVKVLDAEGIEEVNLNLEKRIDLLSHLLVQSPGKLGVSSATSSPHKSFDPYKRTPRPRTMMPKIPSSPGGVRLSLDPLSETALWHGSSQGSQSGGSDSPKAVGHTEPEEGSLQSPTSEDFMRSPYSNRRMSAQLENRSRPASFLRSAPSPSPRPTSGMSMTSSGVTAWGLPAQSDADGGKQRRMRRFRAGSSSLKPLILPTTSAIQPSTPTESAYPSIDAMTQRDFSNVSIDPTTSFISTVDAETSVTTPTHHSNCSCSCSCTAWAQEQTLKALEGKSRSTRSMDSAEHEPCVPTVSSPGDDAFDTDSDGQNRQRSRPRSLQKELEDAVAQAGLGISMASPSAYDDGLIPVSAAATPESKQSLIGIDPTFSEKRSQVVQAWRKGKPKDSDATPKPTKKTYPITIAAPNITKPIPSTTLTTHHAYGLFSRLATLISQTKQDPLVLARLLLANAWALGSDRLGGIRWWLLGSIYHRGRRKCTADGSLTVEEPASVSKDFDWYRVSAEASRQRAVEHYFRNHGSMGSPSSTSKRSSWLEPPHAPSGSRTALPPFTPPTIAGGPGQPNVIACEDCVEPSSRRTMRLWFQFSLAIVLAIGVAIKNGPGALLEDPDAPPLPAREDSDDGCAGERCPGHAPSSLDRRDVSGTSKASVADSQDSGYDSITFVEMLVPKDFE